MSGGRHLALDAASAWTGFLANVELNPWSAELDTRNNRGFGDVGGLVYERDDHHVAVIGRFSAVFIGFSAISVVSRRTYPVAAHRSWKIRRLKL